MNRIGYSKHITGLYSLTLVIAALALLFGASPASARHNSLNSAAAASGTCAQDLFTAAGNSQNLGCTANDVSLTMASNPRTLTGDPLPSCVSGQPFNLLVDFTIVSTSNKTRSNVGMYLGTIPVGQAGSSALTGSCDDNIIAKPHLTGQADSCPVGSMTCLGDPTYDEEDGSTSDNCGDVASASTHVVTVELDGVKCPIVGTKSVVLPDCTTWQVPGKTIACFSDPGAGWPFVPAAAIPGTTSKCNCGTVSIPVTPINPSISVTKTPSPTSMVEPGGAFTYTVVVKNTSAAPVPVTINQICDDQFGEVKTVLTNPPQPACNPNPGPLGSASNVTCPLPATLAVGDTVTCTFDGTVTGTEPLSVKDTVTAHGVGSGVPVSAQASATVSIGEAAAKAQVLKTLDGGQECAIARYKVEVDNLSAASTDESVTVSKLLDDKFGDVTALGSASANPTVVGTTCGVTGASGLGTLSGSPGAGALGAIPVGGSYTCEFDGKFCAALSSFGGCTTALEDKNTITATLTGDESEAVTGSNTATLTVDSCFSHTP